MKAVLAIALAVAIIIIIWMINHPEVKVEKEIQVVTEYVEVPVPVETPAQPEEVSSNKKASSKKLTDAERKASATWSDRVKYSTEKVEKKVEGSAETSSTEIIKNDAKAAEAAKNIVDTIENDKIKEELAEDSSKKVVSNPNDKSVVVGDDNTGKNDNTVKPEEKVEKPFEATEVITSEESKEDSSKATKEEAKNVENKSEEKATEEKTTGAYDLFANNETTEEKTEATPVAPKAPVVESTEVEATETPAATVVLPKEETKKTTEVAPVEVAKKEEATKAPEKVEAPKAAKIANSYVSASKDATAVITVNEGTIVSADAGDGVQVTISGNTVNVKLDTPENSIVDVDMVDSLGNSINAVVAFN